MRFSKFRNCANKNHIKISTTYKIEIGKVYKQPKSSHIYET